MFPLGPLETAAHRQLPPGFLRAVGQWSLKNQVYLKSLKLDPLRHRAPKALVAVGMSLQAAALRVMHLQPVIAKVLVVITKDLALQVHLFQLY